MKKFLKSIISVIISAIVLFVGTIFILKDTYVKHVENTVYVGFSSEELTNKNVHFFNSGEIFDYNSKYKIFNTYTYFSFLKDNEIIIYKALEYALDNSYQYIFLTTIC